MIPDFAAGLINVSVNNLVERRHWPQPYGRSLPFNTSILRSRPPFNQVDKNGGTR